MNRNLTIWAVAIVMIAIAAVAAYVALGDGEGGTRSEQRHYTYYDESDIRLQIYGNADGDDDIDPTDVEILRQIIDRNDADWEDKYVYADANQDGRVTEDDIAVVQHFLDGEKERMYYRNYFDRVSYVNFPMGHKIGTEGESMELLIVDHVYDWWTHADQGTLGNINLGIGDDKYPGASDIIPIADPDGDFDVESVTRSGVETLIMWTGGLADDYFWDAAESSGLADRVSVVMVPIQGREVINGALMFACMLGDQSLSDEYKKWYDEAMELLKPLQDGHIEKKSVLCVIGLEQTTQDTIWAFGDKLSPGLWFNEVINYIPEFQNNARTNRIGYEGFARLATDEVIVMTSRPSRIAPEDYNDYLEGRFAMLYPNTPPYVNQKLYPVDFSMMPSFGGPAGCYILAADLYPDHYDFDKALDFLQEYLDMFWPSKMDARNGYTYTGDGYGPNAETQA